MSEPVTIFPARDPEPSFDQISVRLRALQPGHPRVYAMAAMADQGRRRWWRLADGAREGRIEVMYRRHAAEMASAEMAAEVVATALIHAVVGRVVALLVCDNRAWDPGLENLWIHTDNDGGVDWAGLSDTTVRVVDGDPLAGRPGVVTLPCDRALQVWLAHRCETALTMVSESLARCAGLSRARFWALVGETVVGAATYVPELARTAADTGTERGQALLAAFADHGLPVRRSCLVR
ncbi:IucA/IucC family C-terminal-domain containing protein [Nocardia vermiculata]|uniref:Ferric iron reductase FhuF-like transporter n=1 Tax=Nocardia vermiculata TaxID=257274 RepID=A0A846Y500_9NOCA|nr:IucA/IucC family C-terminal-domain containing protein [Nocardia vermiculata]NKY52791.1 hypothetical protein [Nocardia vermiculata]